MNDGPFPSSRHATIKTRALQRAKVDRMCIRTRVRTKGRTVSPSSGRCRCLRPVVGCRPSLVQWPPVAIFIRV